MSSHPSGFRPELQALRAVAVALVVVYHLWPARLPGGFIGVDVFFVISGYLITSHLLREVDATGTISVTRFWARRIRRLLPAAFTVLLVSAVATLIWVPKAVWQQTFTEIIASAVYVVNWTLAYSATDYLGSENAPSIVQHYWSLSVEEQFYIVWPLLIVAAIAASAWASKRSGGEPARSRTRAILVVLLIVVVASFVYSVIETNRSQPFAFFITPTRAWEFGAGALLAVAGARVGSLFDGPRGDALRASITWAGLAIIAAGAFVLNGDAAFPGFLALIPVVGTVLVIAAGDSRSRWGAMTIGRLKPVQVVGDLSYSIYLWHWPLVVLYPLLFEGRRRFVASIAIIALSVGLAWLTKRFIEDPVRTGAFWRVGRVRSYGIAVTGAALTIALCATPLVILSNEQRVQQEQADAAVAGEVDCFGAAALATGATCPDPFAVPENLDLAFATADLGLLSTKDCKTDAEGGSEVKRCEFGSTSADAPGMVLIGNSHANALASGLAPWSEKNDWKLVTYFRQSCLGTVRDSVGGDPSRDCLEWTDKILAEILADDSISLVVFQSYFGATPKEFSPEQVAEFQANARSVWKELADAGKSVVVVSDVPGTRPDNAPACIEEQLPASDPCSLLRPDFTVGNAEFVAAENTDGVTTIDLDRYFCDDDRCHALIGGVVVYFDSHHLTATYAATLAPFVGAQLQKVFDGR